MKSFHHRQTQRVQSIQGTAPPKNFLKHFDYFLRTIIIERWKTRDLCSLKYRAAGTGGTFVNVVGGTFESRLEWTILQEEIFSGFYEMKVFASAAAAAAAEAAAAAAAAAANCLPSNIFFNWCYSKINIIQKATSIQNQNLYFECKQSERYSHLS